MVNPGATQAIREALKLGECNRYQLRERTGLPLSTCVSIVNGLCQKGGAIPLGTRKSRTYISGEERPVVITEKRVIEWKPLRRNPFEHMQLAMETRR